MSSKSKNADWCAILIHFHFNLIIYHHSPLKNIIHSFSLSLHRQNTLKLKRRFILNLLKASTVLHQTFVLFQPCTNYYAIFTSIHLFIDSSPSAVRQKRLCMPFHFYFIFFSETISLVILWFSIVCLIPRQTVTSLIASKNTRCKAHPLCVNLDVPFWTREKTHKLRTRWQASSSRYALTSRSRWDKV